MLWQLSKTALMSVQTLNSAYAEIYFNNEKIEKAVKPEDESEKQEEEPTKGKEVFRMENVSFAYKNGGTVLKNVSLSIEKNQAVAIIGENGSGKSTLAKLLTGLYQPDTGNVYINGRNSKSIDENYLKRTIGIAFQDFVCYPFSMRENIGYGYIDKLNEDSEIMDAAKRGDAAHLILFGFAPDGVMFENRWLKVFVFNGMALAVISAYVSVFNLLVLAFRSSGIPFILGALITLRNS